MKIAIICNESQSSWIIGKFAQKLKQNLVNLGYVCDILAEPNSKYDINHHVYHGDFLACKDTISTFMITHIDTDSKLVRLKQLLDIAQMGVCMSKDTSEWLIKKGIPNAKTTYILPAHDEDLQFVKTKIGVFSNIYEDGRKNENWILEISESISSIVFEFVFVGEGWESVIKKLNAKGFNVIQFSFSKDVYIQQIKTIDYWLYLGFDEGSMSFLDALQLGKKCIASSQGFQKDLINAVDYPFNNKTELISIFKKLNKTLLSKKEYADNLNWLNFTNKHISLWKYMLNNKNITSENYIDGLNYLLPKKHKNSIIKESVLNTKVLIHKFKKKFKK